MKSARWGSRRCSGWIAMAASGSSTFASLDDDLSVGEDGCRPIVPQREGLPLAASHQIRIRRNACRNERLEPGPAGSSGQPCSHRLSTTPIQPAARPSADRTIRGGCTPSTIQVFTRRPRSSSSHTRAGYVSSMASCAVRRRFRRPMANPAVAVTSPAKPRRRESAPPVPAGALRWPPTDERPLLPVRQSSGRQRWTVQG